jgi:phosphoribosylformimino-5-aminoimidazole carboxamide ribonucleotide (ProFAR) isomerase
MPGRRFLAVTRCKWRRRGWRTERHVYIWWDLNGARTGTPYHLEVIGRIIEVVGIPVQVGGGIREAATVAQLVHLGADRVILGTVAVKQTGAMSAVVC